MKQLKLLWVIAHEPAYLFYRVAEDFKNLVNQYKSIVEIDVEILTEKEYNKKFNPQEPVNRHNLHKLLQDGSVQITQMLTSSLARQCNQQMHVLDMPYIFDNHQHAKEVLEGEVGTYLLNKFDKDSKIKGLAYTYSGGFRLLPVAGTVATLSELAGQPIRSGYSPVAQDTIKAFGFNAVPADLEEVNQLIETGKAVGSEYVAQRIFPDNCDKWINTIVDTEHSLFLTSIVVNVDWWNNLDAQVQDIFMKCALEAARNERELSVQDGYNSVAKLEQSGVKVIKLSQQEKEELRKKVQPVYDKYTDSYFEPGLVSKIKK